MRKRSRALPALQVLAQPSRIIRRGLLLRRRYWINVRPVELRCESTWRCSSGRRDFGQGFFGQSFNGLSSSEPRSRGRSLIASGCQPSVRSWAYSSIGQSPRLITGLFLVRTQVGPLSFVRPASSARVISNPVPLAHLPRGGWDLPRSAQAIAGKKGFPVRRLASEREPITAGVTDHRARKRGARGLCEAGVGNRAAKGLCSWSVPQQHGNEEPTYL